jgi:hypothetical protein
MALCRQRGQNLQFCFTLLDEKKNQLTQSAPLQEAEAKTIRREGEKAAAASKAQVMSWLIITLSTNES